MWLIAMEWGPRPRLRRPQATSVSGRHLLPIARTKGGSNRLVCTQCQVVGGRWSEMALPDLCVFLPVEVEL